jgi:two-component system, LuxR family, response regulator FixJ
MQTTLKKDFAIQRKRTVYIVDEERQVHEAITRLVKPIGADVKTFSGADDFLSDFHDDGPACLILAVRIPGMSGLELQSRLVEAGCQIPVIFVTGDADIRMAVDAMKAGAAHFFEKPFRPQELFEEIQKSLRTSVEAWHRRDEQQGIASKVALLKRGEREVLDLILQGKTNNKIARELQLSVRGVEARRAKVMKTLRVESKSGLIRLLRIPAPGDFPGRPHGRIAALESREIVANSTAYGNGFSN